MCIASTAIITIERFKGGYMEQEKKRRVELKEIITLTIIAVLCVVTFIFDYLPITFTKDVFKNEMLGKIIQQNCGAVAAILLMKRAGIKLFGKVQNWLYLIPCLIISIDNFRFWAYFNAETTPTLHGDAWDYILFSLNCLGVGLFEECIFRGIIFAVLASQFSKDKHGFIQTYVVSSLIFGAAHLFNIFGGGNPVGVIMQVGYTFLTGGLFGFCLIKTKNIFCCAFIHALYNFCGLLFSDQGLGTPLPLDLGTSITMLIVSLIIGAFVIYKTFTISETEQRALYKKLGVKLKEKSEE